jgi:hypothetical protein
LETPSPPSGITTSEDRAKQLEYWRSQLAGELPRVQLPSDRPRPPEESHQGAVERFELPTTLAQALKRLAEKSGGSLYVTLLSGAAALLQRYSGLDEMIIGSSSPERNLDELAAQLGHSENLLRVAHRSVGQSHSSNFNPA